MSGRPVKFGVNLNNREPLIAPDYSLADLLTLAERAEALGFDPPAGMIEQTPAEDVLPLEEVEQVEEVEEVEEVEK